MEIFLPQRWLKSFLTFGDRVFKKILGKANPNSSQQLRRSLTSDIEPMYHGQSQKMSAEKLLHEQLDAMSHSALIGHAKDCERQRKILLKRIDAVEKLLAGKNNTSLSIEQQPTSQEVIKQFISQQFNKAFELDSPKWLNTTFQPPY